MEARARSAPAARIASLTWWSGS